MSAESARDPRSRLIREKYFSLRPRPLERWLWSQGVPPAAERVFWLHWQAGQQRGDWCSQIPLKRVAQECQLDVSTVTRAYQALQRMGCLRRTDPGRDPANPFQQATAITEVRVPRQLLVELDRHPSRRARGAGPDIPAPNAASPPPEPPREQGSEAPDPFEGMTVRERMRALARLTALMSAGESQAYRQALSLHQESMTFDTPSRLGPQERGALLQFLVTAGRKTAAASSQPQAGVAVPADNCGRVSERRPLTLFEVARLKRDIQQATSATEAAELARQVLWSVEEGSLRRFSPLHALHIALKKIRDGAWTRPNRMPPNWSRHPGAPTRPEYCGRA